MYIVVYQKNILVFEDFFRKIHWTPFQKSFAKVLSLQWNIKWTLN